MRIIADAFAAIVTATLLLTFVLALATPANDCREIGLAGVLRLEVCR